MNWSFPTETETLRRYVPLLMSSKALYEVPERRAKPIILPEEIVSVFTLPEFSYKRFTIKERIEVVARITEENVIIRCLPLHIFTYASTVDGALKNFKSLLIDYYRDLKKRKKTLGKNLRQELEYLERIVSPPA
jgi:hypothetical protein